MAEEEVIEIDLTQLRKMKVQEVRKQAGELGLETKGTKAELLARVEKYIKEHEEDLLEEEEEEGEEVGEEAGEEAGEQEEEKPVTAKETKEATPPPQETPPTEQSSSAVDTTSAVKTVTLGGGDLTAAERMAKRAERFGSNSSEEAKKLARAERFGTTLENGLQTRPPPTGEELERMKKRAERFGTNVAPALTSVEENEKKQKRRERFGLGTPDLPDEDRKRARLQRFGAS